MEVVDSDLIIFFFLLLLWLSVACIRRPAPSSICYDNQKMRSSPHMVMPYSFSGQCDDISFESRDRGRLTAMSQRRPWSQLKSNGVFTWENDMGSRIRRI